MGMGSAADLSREIPMGMGTKLLKLMGIEWEWE